MATIEDIDNYHMEYRVGKYSIGPIFKPEQYKTYGRARKEIKTIMDATGYSSLTQKEKEICGRWNLVTDTNELNNLFDSNEQTIITDTHNAQIRTINSGTPRNSRSSNYRVVDEVIYKGSIYTEILNIVANVRAQNGITYSIRVYDTINNQEVALITGLTNTRPTVTNIGTISYQPTNDTILEIQVKRTSGLGRIYYKSIQLEVI